MANVLNFAHSVLPYGMLLTTLFWACDLNLDSESGTRVCKPSDAIDHAWITQLGYEYDGRQWIEKVSRAPAVVDVETEEEAEMDIPPPSPAAPHSPPSPLPAPSTAARSSST